MKYLKKYKLFESISKETIEDILLEITDDTAFNVDIKTVTNGINLTVENRLEVYITRGSYFDSRKTREIPGAPPSFPGYPANLFLWFEIKDTIIRLCEYVYAESGLEPIENLEFRQYWRQQAHFKKSPFRMIEGGGSEFGIGWSKAEDFTLGDFISFTSLKLIIKL